MGVTGLWTVVQPCARPVKLETLAQKRLAIDASIWIYQFLKAVRDKEGNALRNSHIVGFFRRIVKLLFHGIRPVFVFDGGAPLLKKQTIANRKSRREGRRDDASRTAGKLLSLQMQKKAQEEVDRRRRAAQEASKNIIEEEAVPENPVYASELFQAPAERKKNRTTFRKSDQYHLPELDQSLESMSGANDPRVMSMEELERYARQFEGGEDINLYDFSKIDFDSPFFSSLPAADRYNILNAARIRSRLRMGLSKEQLEEMFPNRLEFSRFQIDRVRERNELTQRLMHLNGMNDDLVGVHRVAGEKDREYVLVKNEGAEGGWALGVVGKKGDREGQTKHTAIDVDADEKMEDEEDEWEDEEFEDVPIEGLNRLPKQKPKPKQAFPYTARRRQTSEERQVQRALKLSRQEQQKQALKASEEGAVFIQDDELDEFEEQEDNGDEEYEHLFEVMDDFERDFEAETELRKAIAMSLEKEKQEGEEEERALELALKMSMQQDSDVSASGQNEIEAKADAEERPLNPSKPAFVEAPLNPSKPAFVEAPLNPSKPTFMETPLNRSKPPFNELPLNSSKPKFVEMDEGSGGFGKSRANAEDRSYIPPVFSSGKRPQKDLSVIPSSLTEPRSQMEDMEQSNPFNIMDQDFTLEAAMAQGPTEPKKLLQPKMNAPPSNIDFLPFESMKIGGLAGLKKRREEEKAKKEAEKAEDEKEKVDLPPWFSGQETAAFKAGSTGYRIDNYDRDDFVESKIQNVPEYLRPIQDRTAIQPTNGEPIILSDDEDDTRMDDVALQTRSSPHPRAESPANRDAFDSDQEIEWDPSDPEDIDPKTSTTAGTSKEDLDEQAEYGMSSDEEELLHRLEAENAEHARFAATFNQKAPQEMAFDYDRELRALRDQQKKDRRDADEVNQIMVMECQQLLQLFGIPYITAPMEAEAQCAELVRLGLVDGVVTDDSDIFLFGGTRIYKNMFNQAKFVECYITNDLENEYSLDRRKLIRLAHLLGSDYTEGLPNVGPVTALEILADFGGDDALNQFKAWWMGLQSGHINPNDDKSKLKKKLKRLSDKLFLPATFPDDRVDMAYLNPEVDHDTTPFEWGAPDLQGLRNFLMATIGWSNERTDEVLVPVIRDMNRKVAEGNQVNITNFFTGSAGAGAFAPRVREANKSKRMENALMSLHRQALKRQGSDGLVEGTAKAGDESSSTDEEVQAIVSLNGRVKVAAGNKGKGKTPAKKKRRTGTEEGLENSSEGESEAEVVEVEKPRANQAKAAKSAKARARKPKGKGEKSSSLS